LDKEFELKVDKKKSDVISKLLKNKTILITGGAGSICSVLVKKLLEYPVQSIRVLDMDEHALFRLNRSLKDKRIRLLLGNVLDIQRVERAVQGADIVIHAAAVKNIEITEFNPIETIDINIQGTVNLIQMAIKNKPKIFLNISTDKAANPTTLYGTTKQIGERLTSWAGHHHLPNTKFGTVRFANVIETRGNVFDVWENEVKKNQPITLTDKKVERYFFKVDEAVNFVLKCLPLCKEGEIFVPKMKSHKMIDLANKYSKKHKLIGLRQGEKMIELLLTESEKETAKETKEMWIITTYKNSTN
jgi:UDP-N-acetylglucosamine 4,6-dehydratase/5-epimerase